jgi:hypothetical protein
VALVVLSVPTFAVVGEAPVADDELAPLRRGARRLLVCAFRSPHVVCPGA